MMRKTLRSLLLSASALLLVSACGGGSDSEQAASDSAVNAADLVLRGGTIATVDPNLGTVEAVAVNGYTITAVGSNEDIAAYIGPTTEVVELDGRFAMPGFIEGHGHYMSLGEAKQNLDLNSVANWGEVVSMVATAADKAQPGDWIFGRGWHQDKWDSVPDDAVDGVPRNDTLNRVAPDNPVFLEHASGHAYFANDAALAVAGIDDDTEDPPGGTIVRTPEGKATGLLRETAEELLLGAVTEYNGRLTPQETEQLWRERSYLAAEEALRHGVTSFHDAGAPFVEIDFFQMLEKEGALPVRLYVMVGDQTNDELAELLPHYKMLAEGNDFLTVRSLKRQIDGALGAHGAWLLEPYIDLTSTSGLVLDTVEEIEGTAKVALENGFQVNVHAIGDRANRETLDIYQRAWDTAEVDGTGLRWRIEHAQHIDPEDVPRFGRMGVIAAMQGVHCASDGPWIPSRLGEERAGITSYPWRDLIGTGATIANGTDVPVESINAIASFYASVSRMTLDGTKFHPEHVMTREEALVSYTMNNAIAAFEEDLKGSLTPGKYADIVVLSQDILSVDEEAIPDTIVDVTIVGGEIRYQRPMGGSKD